MVGPVSVRLVLGGVALVALAGSPAAAQVVQAARGSVEGATEERVAGVVASATAVARAVSSALIATPTASPLARQAAEDIASAARVLSEARGDERMLGARFGDFTRAVRRLCELPDTEAGVTVLKQAARCTPAAESAMMESVSQDPFIFVAVPDVVFTVGYEYAPSRGEQPAISSTSLGTNLLGAAVGSAFNAIGSKSLQDYFTSNISAGLSIPSGSRTRLSGAVGVGLGGVSFRGVGLYPALSFEQLDSADARIPGSLVQRRPKESRWSQATLGVAIAYPKLLQNVANGQLGFIASVGLRLPHYFAGDPFSAVGAIFSTKRSEFERAGKSQLTFGVALPLMRVKPQGGGGTTTTTTNPGAGTSSP